MEKIKIIINEQQQKKSNIQFLSIKKKFGLPFPISTTGLKTLKRCFVVVVFLGPHPWHMEVPRLGVGSEL